MSQMQVAEEIQAQIKIINDAKTGMKSAKKALREFILSGEDFLYDTNKLDLLMSEWADTLMTLVEAVGKSFGMEGQLGINNPNPMDPNARYTTLENANLTVAKGAVVISGVIGSILLCYFTKCPWTVGAGLILGVFVIAFFNNIANTIKGWSEKKSDKPVGLNVMSNKISESISFMRNEHVKACFRLKFKTINPQRDARHDPKVDKATVDYKQMVLETLPRLFISRIDDISVECDGVGFGRIMVLVDYLRTIGIGGGGSSQQMPNPGKPN